MIGLKVEQVDDVPDVAGHGVARARRVALFQKVDKQLVVAQEQYRAAAGACRVRTRCR